MERKNEMAVISFRADVEQAARIEQIAKATGKRTSTVVREMVDACLMVQRPIVVSSYQQTTVHHG